MNLFMLFIWFLFGELALFWTLALVLWLVADLVGIDDIGFPGAAGVSLGIVGLQLALLGAAIGIEQVFPWVGSLPRALLVLTLLGAVFAVGPWYLIRQVFQAPNLRAALLWLAGIAGMCGCGALIASVIHNRVVETAKITTHSMTPTLLAEHLEVTCPNCGHAHPLTLVAPEEGALPAAAPPAAEPQPNGAPLAPQVAPGEPEKSAAKNSLPPPEVPSSESRTSAAAARSSVRFVSAINASQKKEGDPAPPPAKDLQKIDLSPPPAEQATASEAPPTAPKIEPPAGEKEASVQPPTAAKNGNESGTSAKPQETLEPAKPEAAPEVSAPAAAAERPVPSNAAEPLPVRCPNCGFAIELPPTMRLALPDQVLIDKAAKPLAWQIAAFRHPLDHRKVVAQRVVGMPGDLMHMVGGDLFRNRNRVTKSLEILPELWLPVFDTAEAPQAPVAGGPNFETHEGSFWKLQEGAWKIDARTSSKRQQLKFNRAITDAGAWNLPQQLPPEVKPLACRDIMVSCELENVTGAGNFGFVWSYGPQVGGVYQPEVTCGALISLAGGKFRLAVTSPPLKGTDPERRQLSGDLQQPSSSRAVLSFAMRDGLIYLAQEGETLAKIPIEPLDVDLALDRQYTAPPSNQLVLFAQECAVTLRRITIHRDVYYRTLQELDPQLSPTAGRNPLALSKTEYMVLGDNSVRSFDSRYFGPVSEKLMLGPVRYRHWPRERWHRF